MHVTAIIAAGGRGQRLGAAQPKQLLHVGNRAILERSVSAFLSHPQVDAVVVALPDDLAADPPEYLRSGRLAAEGAKPLHVVAGGLRRQDSVANAFRAADAATDVIVIHDAARPFASAHLITRTIAAAVEHGAAVAALQARDTVKRAAGDPAGSGARVLDTLPREAIFLAQTPQAFRRAVLADALALDADATDEASLAERAGHPVQLVEGEATNIKITTLEDLAVAEAIASLTLRIAEGGLRRTTEDPQSPTPNQSAIRNPQSAMPQPRPRPARTGRAGTGYDLHRLVEGRPLIIGGVTIPSDRGALGHSDADVVCHALTDAILGAAGLGDIGWHFPDSDPRWKDASSVELLRRAVALVKEQGLEVGNVDVTVVLERPKIRDYIAAMRASLAVALGIEAGRVSIKGKTNEGVDAVGRGEAIAAHAIALIRSH
jgi:2-C-methyl-D-erythritol 4-phosphate cytidylyltransferase/2-C-methyl-D-erythritol 2,4-cyclodiphosphate synthase